MKELEIEALLDQPMTVVESESSVKRAVSTMLQGVISNFVKAISRLSFHWRP